VDRKLWTTSRAHWGDEWKFSPAERRSWSNKLGIHIECAEGTRGGTIHEWQYWLTRQCGLRCIPGELLAAERAPIANKYELGPGAKSLALGPLTFWRVDES